MFYLHPFIDRATSVVFNTTSAKVEVNLNSYFAILCTAADGNPPPTITWIIPSKSSAKQSVGSGGKLLVIESAKRNDTANYTCEAANAPGVTRRELPFYTLGKNY